MAIKRINITHLYYREMNIYGDNGNVEVLAWRLKQYGYKPEIHKIGVGQTLPARTDILVAGGGQDSGQSVIEGDLARRRSQLNDMAKDGVVMLVICGMYQLFGHYFETGRGQRIEGVGVFDAHTVAKDRRLVGNVVVQSRYGRLTGFENHSGQTMLSPGQLPLGKVTKGFGNSETDDREGAVSGNVFGSYLHGPLLPKSPQLADELIRRAVDRAHGDTLNGKIDDTLANRAADAAARRP